MKRHVIFVFYDKEGIVDDYVIYLLESARRDIGPILFMVNGSITMQSKLRVQPLVERIIVRSNEGLDATAYKEGIQAIGYEQLATYDALVLMNDTCFGPISPWAHLFDKMDSLQDVDFWGLTSSVIGIKDLYKEKRLCGRHIDSYFMVFNQRLLRDAAFAQYWDNLPPIHNYDEAVGLNERRMTEFFAQHGFYWDTFCHLHARRDHVFFAPYYLLSQQHCPLLKRRVFTNPNYVDYLCDGRIADLPKVLDYIKDYTNYPLAYLWQHILRFSSEERVLRNLRMTNHTGIPLKEWTNMDLHKLRPQYVALSASESRTLVLFSLKKMIRKTLKFFLYPFLANYFKKMQ